MRMKPLALIVALATVIMAVSVNAEYIYNVGAEYTGDQSLLLDSGEYGGSGMFNSVLRQGTNDVGIILLHGRGENTSDGHVILPLRQELNSLGYTTLSIDTPIPETTTDHPNPFDYYNFQYDAYYTNYVFPELYKRVQTATNELKSLGINKAVLVGFSLGSRMGSAYLSYGSPGEIPILGFVGVGMGQDPYVDLLDTPTSIAGISIPILDLFGSADNQSVLTSANDRMDAYGGSFYTQYMQEGSGHQWVGYESQLCDEVLNWMEGTVNPVPEPATIILLGTGLLGLAGASRKKFKK